MRVCVDCKLLAPLSTHLTGISSPRAVDLIHFVVFLFLLLLPSSFPLRCPLLCPGSAHPTSDTTTTTSSSSSSRSSSAPSLDTANRRGVCEPKGGRLGQSGRGGHRQSPHFHKSRGRAAGRILLQECVPVTAEEGDCVEACVRVCVWRADAALPGSRNHFTNTLLRCVLEMDSD